MISLLLFVSFHSNALPSKSKKKMTSVMNSELHVAAKTDDFDSVAHLLRDGADPNIVNKVHDFFTLLSLRDMSCDC